MAHLPPIGGDQVVARVEVATMARDANGLHTEIDSLRTDMHTEINLLRTDMHTEIDALRSDMHTEVRSLRSDLTSELGARIAEIHGRFDRMFMAQLAGFLALGAAILLS